MISKKHRRVSTTLNYIEHLIISASTVTWCLVGILVGIASSAAGLKIDATTQELNSEIQWLRKKGKKDDKIVFLAKNKLHSTEVLISKTLIDSNLFQPFQDRKVCGNAIYLHFWYVSRFPN